MKSVRIRRFSGPHFSAFGLHTESYGVSLRIQFAGKCDREKLRIRTLFTEYLSIFSPNVGKCGPEKLQIRTLFTEYLSIFSSNAGKCGPEKLQIRTLLTEYLSIFSSNAGKCGPEKLWIRTLFTDLDLVIQLYLPLVLTNSKY